MKYFKAIWINEEHLMPNPGFGLKLFATSHDPRGIKLRGCECIHFF